MDYALSFNICYCSRILKLREKTYRETLMLFPVLHSFWLPHPTYIRTVPPANNITLSFHVPTGSSFLRKEYGDGSCPSACPIMPVLGKGP